MWKTNQPQGLPLQFLGHPQETNGNCAVRTVAAEQRRALARGLAVVRWAGQPPVVSIQKRRFHPVIVVVHDDQRSIIDQCHAFGFGLFPAEPIQIEQELFPQGNDGFPVGAVHGASEYARAFQIGIGPPLDIACPVGIDQKQPIEILAVRSVPFLDDHESPVTQCGKIAELRVASPAFQVIVCFDGVGELMNDARGRIDLYPTDECCGVAQLYRPVCEWHPAVVDDALQRTPQTAAAAIEGQALHTPVHAALGEHGREPVTRAPPLDRASGCRVDPMHERAIFVRDPEPCSVVSNGFGVDAIRIRPQGHQPFVESDLLHPFSRDRRSG